MAVEHGPPVRWLLLQSRLTMDEGDNARLIRVIAAQPYPVSWYHLQNLDVHPYPDPVAALRALLAKGLVEEVLADPHPRYRVTTRGAQLVATWRA
jgi:hypothetical protein